MIHCGDRGVLHSMMYGLHSPVRRRSVLHNPAIVAAGVPTVTERILSAETPEALFRHYAPGVKAYMLKLGTDGALADELAQETLLMVWRKAVQFDRAKASPSTWIFTIARNLRIDVFRKNNRPELDPNDPALVPEAEEPADEQMDRVQRARLIRAAMQSLTEEQAEVIRLSFFEDKSHSVIAGELDLPLGTVKSRLRLAFGRIRKELGEDVL